jgi:hypothetical protein
MHNVGSHMDSSLKSRAQNLHANNAVLDKQISELQASTKALSKEGDKLKKIADDAAWKLKEVGNVQNWAEVMEREFLILEETVRLADASDEEDYGPCRVCGKQVEESGDDLLWCRQCDGEFHPPCVGLEGVPRGEWWCAECETGETYLSSVKAAGDGKMVDDTEDGQQMVNGNSRDAEGSKLTWNLEHEQQATNSSDVEMGGMEGHVEKGKGRETAMIEMTPEGGSWTATNAENPSLNHTSRSTGELIHDTMMAPA